MLRDCRPLMVRLRRLSPLDRMCTANLLPYVTGGRNEMVQPDVEVRRSEISSGVYFPSGNWSPIGTTATAATSARSAKRATGSTPTNSFGFSSAVITLTLTVVGHLNVEYFGFHSTLPRRRVSWALSQHKLPPKSNAPMETALMF